MQVSDHDLLAASLGLAFRYVEVSDLRRALTAGELLPSLGSQGALPPERVAKLGVVTDVLSQLREDAAYGVVALENQLVGNKILNACIDESKREGCKRPLGELLMFLDATLMQGWI